MTATSEETCLTAAPGAVTPYPLGNAALFSSQFETEKTFEPTVDFASVLSCSTSFRLAEPVRLVPTVSLSTLGLKWSNFQFPLEPT
jgi:hypothetical protein